MSTKSYSPILSKKEEEKKKQDQVSSNINFEKLS